MAIPSDRLYGRWLHAHEEDSGDEMVFRPASAELPPSRGRRGLELHPDGSYGGRRPGRDDRPQASSGSWRVEDDDWLVVEEEGASRSSMRIVAAEPDKLVLRKQGQ